MSHRRRVPALLLRDELAGGGARRRSHAACPSDRRVLGGGPAQRELELDDRDRHGRDSRRHHPHQPPPACQPRALPPPRPRRTFTHFPHHPPPPVPPHA